MVAKTQVRWDAILKERTEALLAKRPEEAKHLSAQRRHIEVFHQLEWPTVRDQLRREFRIELDEATEPHWLEPWRAAYWHPSTDLRGRVTWGLTGPLSADAASIAHYLSKGWLTREPTTLASSEQEGQVTVAAPLKVQKITPEQAFTCEQCGKPSGHRGAHLKNRTKEQ